MALTLERMSELKVSSTVAHEFAAALLRHATIARPGTVSSKPLPCRQADMQAEIEADKFEEKWGFKPAYDRSNKNQSVESI